MGRPSKWSPEFREEAVRAYRSGRDSIPQVARRIGVHPETFRKWVRRAQVDAGEREGYTAAEREGIRQLRARVRRLEEEKVTLQKAGTVTFLFTDIEGSTRPAINDIVPPSMSS